jgi:hypothetical protein
MPQLWTSLTWIQCNTMQETLLCANRPVCEHYHEHSANIAAGIITLMSPLHFHDGANACDCPADEQKWIWSCIAQARVCLHPCTD